MREYEKHIAHTHKEKEGTSWCGEKIYEWAFVNIDHAVYNTYNMGRLIPCERCAAAVAGYLLENLSTLKRKELLTIEERDDSR